MGSLLAREQSVKESIQYKVYQRPSSIVLSKSFEKTDAKLSANISYVILQITYCIANHWRKQNQ